MRIGLDVSQIVYGTGVSVYTKNLVENLLRVDHENEYILFFSSLRKRLDYSFINGLTGLRIGLKKFIIPPTLLDWLWNRLHILPIEKFVGEVDVFHTSDWTEPPAGCPKVTTIHDLTPLLYPDQVHPKIVAAHKRRLEWVKKESFLVIAVSKATKRDITRVLQIPGKRIKVIYEGIEAFFKPQEEEAIKRVKKKYKIRGDYLLAFSGPARKNINRVKKAVFPHQLFIVGQTYVSREELPALYSGARCLVYPSLYEGFGLPILEAMACGCPVVTSNLSSMPEIAGKAAVLVDPESVGEIAKGIKKALGNREELIKKGFKRVRQFSWRKTAQETLKVYHQASISYINI